MKKILLILAVCLAFTQTSHAKSSIASMMEKQANILKSKVEKVKQEKLEKLAKESNFKYNCFDKNDNLVFATNDKDEAQGYSQVNEYICLGLDK